MNFFDELYVGFQRDRYNTDENPRLLGFAVPYDKTKASEKRQSTVNNWRQKDINPRIIENKPTRGFKLLQVVSRYSTSNKLFRVLDPRGFELEISSDNLLDIALASTIVKGEIIEECVWASSHNGAYLMPSSDERYSFYVNKKQTGDKVKMAEGNYYVSVRNMVSVFRYEGIYHHTYLDIDHVATEGDMRRIDIAPHNYYHRPFEIDVKKYTTDVKIRMNSGKKPSYVYTEFTLNSDGGVERKSIHIRKSHFKNLIKYDDITQEMKDYKPDMMQWVNTTGSYYEEKGKSLDSKISNNPGVYNGYFKSKDEAKNFDYSEIIRELKPNTRSYYSGIDTSKITSYNTSMYGAQMPRNVNTQNAEQTFEIEDLR